MTNSTRRLAKLGTAALLAAGAALAGCAGPVAAPSGPPATSSVAASTTNPFGVTAGSSIDAVGFDGGYKTDYLDFAGNVVTKNLGDVTVKVTPTTKIATELQPRFVGGNPPDLLNNNGADTIAITSIQDQLTTLDDLWASQNYDGVKVADAVFPGVDTAGTYGGKFIQLNYVMTLFSLWYSQSLFEANGFTPPTTWDGYADLCTAAKAKDLHLFAFGKEASTYYKWLALDSAIKEGGVEVMENIANLKPGAWSDPTVVAVLGELEQLVKDDCFIPGGAGTQFTQAQAQWSSDKRALFYMSGSWIESEMKDVTAKDFKMTAWPVPTLTANSKLPFTAVQAGASEPFMIPAKAANMAGAKELLRAMLSKEAAANFSKTRLAPTIVKDTVPADGYGSTALASAMKAMEDAGPNIFSWVSGGYDGYYAIGTEEVVMWNSFLSGEWTAAELIKAEEALNAKTAADTTVSKVTYDY